MRMRFSGNESTETDNLNGTRTGGTANQKARYGRVGAKIEFHGVLRTIVHIRSGDFLISRLEMRLFARERGLASNGSMVTDTRN